MKKQETDKQICHYLVYDENQPMLPRYCGRAAYTEYSVSPRDASATGGLDCIAYRAYYCDRHYAKKVKELGDAYQIVPVGVAS